jgi:arabinofuranosyltransferase
MDSVRRRHVGVRALIGVLVCLLAVVVVREAWVADDAFITFRTLDNFVHGLGLRWNTAERVQSFTHPLWLFLLAPAVLMSGNPYLTAIGLSLILSAVTVGLVIACAAGRPWRAVLAITAMLLAKGFTEYSTSGLENALSHALLAGLMVLTMRPLDTRGRAVAAGLLVAAIGLTRLDLLLLAAPIALSRLRSFRQTIAPVLVGGLPLALWELFSVIYYGVPFPNTAYAKLATGIPHSEMMLQGLTYFADSLTRDPITLFTIGAGIAAVFAQRRRDLLVPAIAVLVYLVYVMRIGGDFMSGRFFTAPFVVSLCLLARTDEGSLIGRWTTIGVAAALGLSVPHPTVTSGSGFTTVSRDVEIHSASGIADERAFYFQQTGWISASGARRAPDVGPLLERLAQRKEIDRQAFGYGNVGLVGYYTGSDRQIVDGMALCDPLLARLPAIRVWRVGHYQRDLPAGYLESVIAGNNQVEDPAIASLYEVIREVTRGPLWTSRRWSAVVALNTGRTADWPVQR